MKKNSFKSCDNSRQKKERHIVLTLFQVQASNMSVQSIWTICFLSGRLLSFHPPDYCPTILFIGLFDLSILFSWVYVLLGLTRLGHLLPLLNGCLTFWGFLTAAVRRLSFYISYKIDENGFFYNTKNLF